MNSKKPRLAIDAMGGDFGPLVVVPGAIKAARETGSTVILVGREDDIRGALSSISVSEEEGELFEVVNADEVIEMTDKPRDVIRGKKNSSMHACCRLVRDGKADAFISAGNSGVAYACATLIIGRIPGVERAALASLIPTEKAPFLLLDVGANVSCRANHLFQFGIMGACFMRDAFGCENPRVSIVSNGEEEGKGNDLVRESYGLFKQARGINFVGNAEGRDLFTGDVDVAVCDGFVGNVILKLSEGLATSLSHMVKRELSRNPFVAAIVGLLARSAFKRVKKTVDYAEYGGAPLLGLKGLAIVCHGKSNEKAIVNALKLADAYVRKDTQQRLVDAIGANEEISTEVSSPL